MPQVEFHSGVAAPTHYACRLLRKACRQRVPVLVTAPAATLELLDRELWTFEALEFVPHRRVHGLRSVDAALGRTPIWLCEVLPSVPGPKVLLNIDGEAPANGDAFERIIEIVAAGHEQVQRGRARWREYESRGWPLRHHPHAGRPG